MLGIGNEEGLQQSRRLERPREGLVRKVMVGTDGEPVEDPRLDVVGRLAASFSIACS